MGWFLIAAAFAVVCSMGAASLLMDQLDDIDTFEEDFWSDEL